MTKKHFIAFANEIAKRVQYSKNSSTENERRIHMEQAIGAYNVCITIFLHDNPRFNVNRFHKACGL